MYKLVSLLYIQVYKLTRVWSVYQIWDSFPQLSFILKYLILSIGISFTSILFLAYHISFWSSNEIEYKPTYVYIYICPLLVKNINIYIKISNKYFNILIYYKVKRIYKIVWKDYKEKWILVKRKDWQFESNHFVQQSIIFRNGRILVHTLKRIWFIKRDQRRVFSTILIIHTVTFH